MEYRTKWFHLFTCVGVCDQVYWVECSSLLSEFQQKKWLVTTKCAPILTPGYVLEMCEGRADTILPVRQQCNSRWAYCLNYYFNKHIFLAKNKNVQYLFNVFGSGVRGCNGKCRINHNSGVWNTVSCLRKL